MSQHTKKPAAGQRQASGIVNEQLQHVTRPHHSDRDSAPQPEAEDDLSIPEFLRRSPAAPAIKETSPKPPSTAAMALPIADIIVRDRHRRDMGDLDALARNIAELGLLQPIVITPDNVLIAGARRLAACKRMDLTEIPVHVVDVDSIARGELAENTHRKDFTPSEMVAIAATVEQYERDHARKRMTLGKIATGSERGKTRDKIAAPLGISGKTLEKAKAVVEAAEAEPGNFKTLLDDMDRTGSIDGAFRRLRNAQQAQAIRAEPPALPDRGPYRVGVVDLPWPSEPHDRDPATRAYWPYPTISLEQARVLNIGSLMHADSILWFWVTNFHLRFAYGILSAWGFNNTPTMLTWAKRRCGHGCWLRGQTEHAILAVRGKPIVTLTNETTLLHAPVRGHSRKPVEFYDMVERLCPAPRYLDLFSRYQHNYKWDCHGDQAPAATEAVQ